jgi:hypothetical protein
MWSFLVQPGVASVVVDFTNALSPLGIGLVGLMLVAAGAITFSAIQHSWSQAASASSHREHALPDFREAA